MRADLYLATFKYTESRQKAATHIKNGAVTVDSKKITKPSEEIDELADHHVIIEFSECDRYVSRGALKLVSAIESFEIDVGGRICVDIGASTGGFTDCLLQKGAKRVFAFDSGKGQLHPKLANDERVISKEGFNARYIRKEDIDETADIAVMDVSFISQTKIIPALVDLLSVGGIFVSLIKPQFEVGKEAVGKNGIVKKAEPRLAAARRVIACAEENGFGLTGFLKSPINGGDGNEEYLACFVKGKEISLNDKTLLQELIKNTVKSGQ